MTKSKEKLPRLALSELVLSHGEFENPRLDQGSINKLADAIFSNGGLLYPLIVWRVDGRNVVIDGGRRYRALKLLADKGMTAFSTAPVQFVEAPDATEARLKAVGANAQRKALTSYELAVSFDRLVKAGVSIRDIAREVFKPGPWIQRVLSTYRHATPDLRELWQHGNLGLAQIVNLSMLSQSRQVEQIREIREWHALGNKGMPAAKAAKAAKAPGETPARPKMKAIVSPQSATDLVRKLDPHLEKSRYVRGVRDMMKDYSAHHRDLAHLDYLRGLSDAYRLIRGELNVARMDAAYRDILWSDDDEN